MTVREASRDNALAKQREANHRWYAKNKENLNARRRQRYAKDQSYRTKQVEEAQSYRDKKKEAGLSIYRTINGTRVEVFTISATADLVGRSTATIRKWETTGMIPKTIFGGVHRVYTENQVRLLRELAELLDGQKASVMDRVVAKSKFLPKLEKKWAVI